jgi:hypothetical protein
MGRYSAKQKRIRGVGGRSKRQFIRFFTNVKRSKAYHGLSRTARALLFEMLDRYTGINNGMIGLGVREAKYELGCSHGTVVNAMRETPGWHGRPSWVHGSARKLPSGD